jgi:hypothetical protein
MNLEYELLCITRMMQYLNDSKVSEFVDYVIRVAVSIVKPLSPIEYGNL